jgi:hypothetical protein
MVCTKSGRCASKRCTYASPSRSSWDTESVVGACDLARWLGQAAGLLRGHGGPIEEMTGLGHGCDPPRGEHRPAKLETQTRRGWATAGEDHVGVSQAWIE